RAAREEDPPASGILRHALVIVISRDEHQLVSTTPPQLGEEIAEIALGSAHLVRAERDHIDADPHGSVPRATGRARGVVRPDDVGVLAEVVLAAARNEGPPGTAARSGSRDWLIAPMRETIVADDLLHECAILARCAVSTGGLRAP